jgi:hypothetical protein
LAIVAINTLARTKPDIDKVPLAFQTQRALCIEAMHVSAQVDEASAEESHGGCADRRCRPGRFDLGQ